MNFALNGDLSNTNTMAMINSGSERLTWVNGLLRLDSGDSQSGCNFKTSELPITGCYTWYIKFKKVSGSGRVVLDYTCYADMGADDPVGTEYYASKMYVNNSTSAKTNLYVRLPANTVIDIVEVGYTLGESAEVNLPLYYKAKI